MVQPQFSFGQLESVFNTTLMAVIEVRCADYRLDSRRRPHGSSVAWRRRTRRLRRVVVADPSSAFPLTISAGHRSSRGNTSVISAIVEMRDRCFSAPGESHHGRRRDRRVAPARQMHIMSQRPGGYGSDGDGFQHGISSAYRFWRWQCVDCRPFIGENDGTGNRAVRRDPLSRPRAKQTRRSSWFVSIHRRIIDRSERACPFRPSRK